MPERTRTCLGALFAPTLCLTLANALVASCARPEMIPSPPPHRTTTPAPPAAARAPGRTMGADGVLDVLMGEGEGTVVAHLSGCLAPRGTDFVRDVDLLPARDAVTLMPEGTWAVDARRLLPRVARDCGRRVRATPVRPAGSGGPRPRGVRERLRHRALGGRNRRSAHAARPAGSSITHRSTSWTCTPTSSTPSSPVRAARQR